MADLFGLPSTVDATLACTNVRTISGKRPLWADNSQSIFYFPWNQIRFLEVPPTSTRGVVPEGEPGGAQTEAEFPDEPELEIDEEFLRRVRDV